MKKIFPITFSLIALIVLLLAVFSKSFQQEIYNLIYISPCDSPIHYRVDYVDSRFNLTKDQFMVDIEQAGNQWSSVYGKNLFVYDPKGDLTIDMVFDERQSLTDQINQSEGSLQNEKSSIDPQLAEYQQRSADFKKRLSELNAEIDYWNSHGGAQPDEYAKLKSEQQSLQAEAAELNGIAQKLNQSTDAYNSQVAGLNQTVDTLNTDLKAKPEEGLYESAGPSITIYFNNGRTELVHTLIHEMGHALGMAHVTDPNAIMYATTNDTVIPTREDIAELERACQKVNILWIVRSKISRIVENYQQK